MANNKPNEPKECPYCGASFFVHKCRECGYDENEDINLNTE